MLPFPTNPVLKSLPVYQPGRPIEEVARPGWYTGRLFKTDRKSTRLNCSHSSISYAVFCLKKKNTSLQQLSPAVSPLGDSTLPLPAPHAYLPYLLAHSLRLYPRTPHASDAASLPRREILDR